MKLVYEVNKINEITKAKQRKASSKQFALVLLLSVCIISYIFWAKGINPDAYYYLIGFIACFFLMLILETIIHECIHGIGILFVGGKPKFSCPRSLNENPQVYCKNEENQYFTRSEYIFCLLLPVIILTLAVIPFYFFTENVLFTLVLLFIIIGGSEHDITETNKLFKYKKSVLINMRIEKVNGREKCVAIEIYEERGNKDGQSSNINQ